MKKILLLLCFYEGIVQASLCQKIAPVVSCSVGLEILRGVAQSATSQISKAPQFFKKSARTSRCVGRASRSTHFRLGGDTLEKCTADVERIDARIKDMSNRLRWTQVATILLLGYAIKN